MCSLAWIYIMMVWFRVTLRLCRAVQFCDIMQTWVGVVWFGVLAGVGAFNGEPPEGNVFGTMCVFISKTLLNYLLTT